MSCTSTRTVPSRSEWAVAAGFACSSGTLLTSSFTSESLGYGQSAAEEEYQTPERSANDRWQLALGIPWSLDERSVCRGRELSGSAGIRGNETRCDLARSPLSLSSPSSPSSPSYPSGSGSSPVSEPSPSLPRRTLPFPSPRSPGLFLIPFTTPTTLSRPASSRDVHSQ